MYESASVPLSPTWRRTDDPLEYLAQRRAGFSGGRGVTEADLREIVAQTYGMISHVDDQVGRVLAELERQGLAENTVVAFTSDHGEYLGAHGLLYKSCWPYEELYRVPLIWRVPGGRAGQAVDAPASLLDVVPTVLDYAGIDPRELDLRRYGRADRPTLPGRSLRPCLDIGQAAPDRPVLVEFDEDGLPGAMLRMRTIIRDRHKLTVYPGVDEGLLFDLSQDPDETINRWSDPACRDLRAELLFQLAAEQARTDRLDVTRISGA